MLRRVTSRALQRWRTAVKADLDQIEAAHAALGGKSRGRRYATLQLNHAYVMLLSSQFQGFCRELHTEAVDWTVKHTTPGAIAAVLSASLLQGRKLDSGNPNPGNIGSDFARVGLPLWQRVTALGGRNVTRQQKLEELNTWRNAVAHQDWSKVGPDLQLKTVKGWRAACDGLAASFDKATRDYLTQLAGAKPW